MSTLVSATAVVTPAGRIGDAVLIEDGNVAAVGERSAFTGAGVDEVHYRDGVIVPGLRDAHIHAVPYAALLSGCSLKAATSMGDLVERLATHAARLAPDAPVVATRMDDEHLSERRLPTRHDLDRAVPDRPAVIYRYCGHVAVANTAALAASGISSATSDPDGGSLDRDDHGEPTGVLRETAAGLIAPALARGGGMAAADVLTGLTRLAGLGITSVGAMIGYGESPHEKLEAEVELLASVADRLPITVHGIVITDDPDQLSWAAETLNGAGPRLRWLGVKRFADGSLGGHTAAMHHAFADVDTTGTYRLTPTDTAIAAHAVRLGGMVAIHAIGDRAVSGVLDVFDDLIANGADPADLRMEHVSVIDPAQIERFATMGVSACVQPAFLASESDWVADRVGVDRASWLYPFRSMLAAGIPMIGSSDCPVEPPHPLWGIASAIDRHGVSPSEALSPRDALAMFTTAAARSLREPAPLGAGSAGDLVVIDVDPLSAPAGEIRHATILDTYVGGVAVDVDRSLPAWVD